MSGLTSLNQLDQKALSFFKQASVSLMLVSYFDRYEYPEENFCLLTKIPFNKLVFPIAGFAVNLSLINFNSNGQVNCFTAFLYKYSFTTNILFGPEYVMNNRTKYNLLQCDFKKMINNCRIYENKSYYYASKPSYYDETQTTTKTIPT